MDHTAVPELLDSMADDVDDPHYHEFLRRDSLSVGVYRLPAGAVDPQEPHTEDEVYYVVSGRATIEVADESTGVEAGDVVFVERGVDHRFVDIETELVVLVFFAPAEGMGAE
ncbi:cupin domain-containing protein [Salinigranum salinum]|uniref:cupin domain-containing protein n=1 Tax=Salinigranum salinum TaxID=1364937 RepID=UPI001958F707|nr:cupin domain-containing protein [Salinigranum salinum]